MNRLLKIFLFFFIVFLASCTRNQNNFQETKDDELTVQFKSIKGNEEFSYAVRIFLKGSVSLKREELYKKMWYQMDSCFYIINGTKKIYPVFQQPIANGLHGSFEYLIAFDKVAGDEAMKFVFDNKNLNKKIYSFNL